MLAISPEEVQVKVANAYHKANIIEGLARSPKRGLRKDATLRGLVDSLANDVDTLASVILDGET